MGWVDNLIVKEVTKHKSEHLYRIERLEKCCEKVGSNMEESAKEAVKTADSIERLNERLEEFKIRFDEHDREEMRKYEAIEANLRWINRYITIGIGIGITLHFLGSVGALERMFPWTH